MKKILAFLVKHGWWVAGASGFLVWKYEHPLWDWFWTQAGMFVNDLYEVAKPILDKLSELWKSWTGLK